MLPSIRNIILGGGRKLLISDSFNRADDTTGIGKADTGQTWSYLYAASRIQVVSNTAKYVGTTICFPYINCGKRNIEINSKIATFINQMYPMVFRFVDDNNYFSVRTAGSGTTYVLYKRVASTNTTIQTYSVAPADGDLLKVTIKNNVIKVYLNGLYIMGTKDSDLGTITNVGLGTGSSQNACFDNFSVYAI